ncbi:unnamed protein product [Arctia plantaginis]|uniref:NACHT domain-containing protein n=1 Tax=Arctia plantaginis TaxID=874455 RepID=A0A8S0ZFL4_ARCPL|nr:unnamed protein product [Arctia plantaginis]
MKTKSGLLPSQAVHAQPIKVDKNQVKMYKKRSGTSGISGQLYEMNLISYTLFGLLHNMNIEEFHLASNLDEIGAFDDVCFKVKIKALDKALLVFIQSKHKEGDDKLDFDVSKYFPDSYSQVIQKFYTSAKSKSKDKLFTGKFDDHECIFILYTNAKYKNDSGIEWTSDYAGVLNDLIATGKNGSQLIRNDKIIEESAETISKEEINTLAIRFAKFFNENSNQSMNIMLDDYILRYHVLLASKVIDVSEIQCETLKTDSKFRILTFRPEFFDTSDKYLVLLKKSLCRVVLKNQINTKVKSKTEDESVDEPLKAFFFNPCSNTLSSVLGTCIEYKNGKLEFIYRKNQRLPNDIEKLKQIYLPQSIIEEAETIAARKMLLSLKLKVPSTFGNRDLVISERRVDHLTKNIINLCQKSKANNCYNIVTLDDTIEDGLLRLNGGLAGAVGNLLVYDQTTNLLKLTDNLTSQQTGAKLVLDKLKTNLNNWHEYRFEIKANVPFPKLSFDSRDTAKEILCRVVIYAQQSNHKGVQELLRNKIQEYHSTTNPDDIQVDPDLMFQSYRNEILKWWLLSEKGPYLTKDSDIYQRAIKNIVIEPRITSLQITFYMTKMKNIEYTIDSLQSLNPLLENTDENGKNKLDLTSVVVTDVTTLTAIKVIQYLRKVELNNYVVLDLESIVKLSIDDFYEMKTELKNTKKILIILCNVLLKDNTFSDKYVEDVSKLVEQKQKIIVVNQEYVDVMKKLFISDIKLEENIEKPDTKIIYEKNKLIDLNKESQKIITENCKILFEGQLINLDLFIDDVSVAFIEGNVLNKIIQNEPIEIGESLNDDNYAKIKDLYQDRRVEYVKSQLYLGRISISTVEQEDFKNTYSTNNILLNLCSYFLNKTERNDNNNFTAYINEYLRNDAAQTVEQNAPKHNMASNVTVEETENDDCKYKVEESVNNYIFEDYCNICYGDISSIIKVQNCYVILDEDGCKHHIIFQFECCLDLRDIKSPENLRLYDIRDINGKPTICSCFSFKKEEVQGKLWIVKIKFLGFLKDFSKWKTNKTMIADTLLTLKSMCQRYILNFLIQNKSSGAPHEVSDNLNVETMNTVFKEKQDPEKEYFWFREHPTTIFAQQMSCSNNNSQKAYSNEVTTVDQQTIDVSPNTENNVKTEDIQEESHIPHNLENIDDDDAQMSPKAVDQESVKTDSDSFTPSKQEEENVIYTTVSLKMLKPGVFTDVIIGSYVMYEKTKSPVVSEYEFTSSNGSKFLVKGTPLVYKPGLTSSVGYVDFLFRFHYNRNCELKTFSDINDDVVHVTAPPGMGKSTLLTHLALKTKETDKTVWIVRVNLRDYSTEFNRWQKDINIVINTMATLKLLCQVVLKDRSVTFELKEVSDKMYLEECSDNNLSRFYLNMFLHYYNEKKLIFLFDGFDEICPDYSDEVIQFLKVVKHLPRKNKIWITSRSYNPMPSLQRNIGRAYKMQSFSKSEQTDFLSKFWERKFMLKILTEINVKSFLEFMLSNISEIDYNLRVLCYHFYSLIISKFPCLVDEMIQNVPELKLKVEQMENVYKVIENPANGHLKLELDQFMGTPLLLCLAGEYIVNEVLNAQKLECKGNFNTLTMYEKFVENNLKRNIHDKYGMNIDVPYFKDKFTAELKECMTMYKRIGAHVIFGSPLFSKFNFCFEEFNDVTPFCFNAAGQSAEYSDIISRLRIAKEKTGLISYVTFDSTPMFIHKTFAEYFAFEFVCDVLKSRNHNFRDKKLIWIVFRSIISNDPDSTILNKWMQEKIKMDDEFNDVVENIQRNQAFIDKYVKHVPLIKKKYANKAGALRDTLLQCAYVGLLNSSLEDFEDPSFIQNNIEDYLSRRREIDNDLISVMKPHLKKYFPGFVSRPMSELIPVL